MFNKPALFFLCGTCVLLMFFGCKKDTVIVPGNIPPDYNKVSTILVENYVNRIFIDLIGREPLDAEMDAEVKALRSGKLDVASRSKLINKLQFDSSYVEGDSSYYIAYYHRFYEVAKVRMIEGASEPEINQPLGIARNTYYIDSLIGDSIGMAVAKQTIEKFERLLGAEFDYRYNRIDIVEVFDRMLNNGIYDLINMNSFNFINASFDDLFFRFPTQDEFYKGFDMIEFNKSSSLFGIPGQNKGDYIDIVVNSREFHEGIIIWAYKTIMAREPTTYEVEIEMISFFSSRNFQQLQENIIITDEYANFD